MDAVDRAGVTAREREVLRLLGDRLTNIEIADKLFISVRTVESHVSSLLMKLGAERRRDLARFKTAASLRGFPTPHTRLIGRESQIEEIRHRIGESRLVTLSGVGGSGKTRLAVEVATKTADGYRDGASFTDLGPLHHPDLIAGTVAKSVGFEQADPAMSLEDRDSDLVARLSSFEGLIVLDNCEHLLEATGRLVSRILDNCQEVRVLVTTREAFGFSGESIHWVPPLQLPDEEVAPQHAEAVLLFVDRAEAVRSGMDLLGRHLGAVVDVCSRLDGIPLAIELAAVQVAHLTPEELAERLDDRFRLLAGRHPDDPRHATLKTTIDWSFEVLSDPKRALLARLGVFPGWFGHDAVEAVCATEPLDPTATQTGIGSLVWKSLVVASTQEGASRYRLLETVRAYALERLAELEQGEEMRARHCAWCIHSAEEAAPHLVKAGRDKWLRRLDDDLPNLRAALDWAITEGRSEEASRLFVALWRYWHMRGDIAEGMRRSTQILALEGAEPEARARTLEAAGGLAYWSGDMALSRDLYQEGMDLVRNHGSEAEIANALYNTSFPYGFGGMTQPALDYLEEARAIYERLDDEEGVAKCLWGWGASAYAGGRLSEARVSLEHALSIYETLDDTFMLAWAQRMLGTVLLGLGETEEAKPHLEQGLLLFHAAGDVSGIILHLGDYAQPAVNDGDSDRALILVGALAALQDSSGLDLVAAFSEQIGGLEEVSETLGQERVEDLFQKGMEMSREQAIQFATADREDSPSGQAGPNEHPIGAAG